MSSSYWLRYFVLERPPFSKEVSDADLWVPSSRERVVDAIVDACRERGHILLTGEPGVGKTCVLRSVRSRLPEAGFRLTYCHNATLGRRDFYRQLCLALGLSPKATAASVFYAITEHVKDLTNDKLHPVFLLDEAHLLQQQVLDHLHILTNYEWDSSALLSLVLVGLPELDTRLRLSRNRSLWSRIHTRLHLGEAKPEDTAEYVERRLLTAGCARAGDIFDSDALALLHEASGGRLRDIDRIAAQRQLHSPIDDNYISPVVVVSVAELLVSVVVVVAPFQSSVVVAGASWAGRPVRRLLGVPGVPTRSAASSARTLFPTISMITAWCTRRSIAAAVVIGSLKMRSHSLKTRLLVITTLLRSYLWARNVKRTSISSRSCWT